MLDTPDTISLFLITNILNGGSRCSAMFFFRCVPAIMSSFSGTSVLPGARRTGKLLSIFLS